MDHFEKPEVKPYLTTRLLVPENQETPIHFLRQEIIPREYFYNRNHFPYPQITEDSFLLAIDGEVEKKLEIDFKSITDLPSKSITLPLECSGNRRAYFKPKVYGDQWRDGAITQGEWKGVPLSEIFSRTGIKDSGVEVVFEGHDFGKKPGADGVTSFARSLPIQKAMHPDTIIAYEYNGAPIPVEHGYPLRLIVPQWYAMASVKWLKKITVISTHFKGPFQADDYVYYPNKENNSGARPVTTINVNSIIQHPLNYQILDEGEHNIDGIAWAGDGRIERVEVSFDGGKRWCEAKLYQNNENPYALTFWNLKWNIAGKGEYTIISRAYSSTGKVQPLEAFWNRKGYGYNAVYIARVKVE